MGINRLRCRWFFIVIFFFIFFIIRLIFGLFSEFWFPDELQIYLLGLKFYSTKLWPYFGPDVVYTSSQIPGALQALLVGLPFFVLPVPEAPFILLNILSFFALLLLGWYIGKLLPEIPKWFLWIYLFTAPWVLNISTHILNVSYLLFGSVIFFIGVLELIPQFRKNLISPYLGMAMIGFGFFWVYQLHMSWVLMVPFIILVFIFQLKEKKSNILKLILFFILGSLITGSLVIPTYIKYGFIRGTGGTYENIKLQLKNLLNILNIVVRFFSFASFEISRFIGAGTKSRLLFLKEYKWVGPFIIYSTLFGVSQIVIMIINLFYKEKNLSWRFFKILIVATILLIYLSFLFSIKGPSAHTFYVVLPLSMIYFFLAFRNYLLKKFWRRLAIIFLFSAIVVHIGIEIRNLKEKSLYKNRSLVVKSIQEKNFLILGERRKTKSGIGY